MPTNHVFSTSSISLRNEQNLLEDLIDECVKIHGVDCYYIPRTSEITINNLLGEQPDTRLTGAYLVCVYMVNVEGYDGENEFLSKFGLNVRSSTNIVLTAREFSTYVGLFPWPREGDLIWMPMLRRMFEIKFVDPDVNFHALGRDASRPYYYELRLEQFKYSQENIQTGVSEIDAVEIYNSYTINLQLGAGSGNFHIGEEVYQGGNYITSTSTAKVTDWNPNDKILSITDIRGTMNASSNVTGTSSGTTYVVASTDDLDNVAPDEVSDNSELKISADNILIVDETNPLG